ncbi:MAG: hypothetical protein HC888_10430 [Candidatus Competibacteraceae bacterium]|nr:hypothetical protein [Candidatus Competibacteraceae bacterium]
MIGRHEFRYDRENDCIHCPGGKVLRNGGTCKTLSSGEKQTEYLAKSEDCHGCPLRERCTTSKTGRKFTVSEHHEYLEGMELLMSSSRVRARYRKRQGRVEPVFSSIRGEHKFNRFRRRGLLLAKLEFSLVCLAYNIKRVWRLLEKEAARAVLSALAGGLDALRRLLGGSERSNLIIELRFVA